MRILHIKVNGMLNKEGYDKIRNKIENELNNGFLITDESIQTEVLEINIAKLEEASYPEDLFKRDYMCQWVDKNEEVKPIRPEVSG